jgi:hypothetical protein
MFKQMNVIKECKLEESVLWNLYTHDSQFVYIYFYVRDIQIFLMGLMQINKLLPVWLGLLIGEN